MFELRWLEYEETKEVATGFPGGTFFPPTMTYKEKVKKLQYKISESTPIGPIVHWVDVPTVSE